MRKPPVAWNPEWDPLLGTDTDAAVGSRVGCSATTARKRRSALGIGACKGRKVPCFKCGREVKRKLWKANAPCRECFKQGVRNRAREWYEAHKLQVLEKRDAYKATHREQDRIWHAKYRKRHAKKIRAAERKKRAAARKEVEQIAAEIDRRCDSCGNTHTEDFRLRQLRRLLPATSQEIHEAWECIWGPAGKEHKGSAGSQRLRRDLQKLGAQSIGKGNYILPQKASVA